MCAFVCRYVAGWLATQHAWWQTAVAVFAVVHCTATRELRVTPTARHAQDSTSATAAEHRCSQATANSQQAGWLLLRAGCLTGDLGVAHDTWHIAQDAEQQVSCKSHIQQAGCLRSPAIFVLRMYTSRASSGAVAPSLTFMRISTCSTSQQLQRLLYENSAASIDAKTACMSIPLRSKAWRHSPKEQNSTHLNCASAHPLHITASPEQHGRHKQNHHARTHM